MLTERLPCRPARQVWIWGWRVPVRLKVCLSVSFLSEQDEGYVGAGIRLREHGRGGLDEDVVLGQLRAFLGDVDVHDPPESGLHVGAHLGDHVTRKGEPGHGSSILSPQGRDVLQGLGEDGGRHLVQGDGAVVIGGSEGEDCRVIRVLPGRGRGWGCRRNGYGGEKGGLV